MWPRQLLLIFLAQAFATAQAQNSCSGYYTIFSVLSGDAAADQFCSEHFPAAPVTSTVTSTTETTVTATSSTAITATATSTSTVYTASTAQKRHAANTWPGPSNSVATKSCSSISNTPWQPSRWTKGTSTSTPASTTTTARRTSTSTKPTTTPTSTSTKPTTTPTTTTSSQTHTTPNLFSSIVSAESSIGSRACACITAISTTTVSTTTTATVTSTVDTTGTITSTTTTTVTSPCDPAITENCADQECFAGAPCCAGFTCAGEPPFNEISACYPTAVQCPASVTSTE